MLVYYANGLKSKVVPAGYVAVAGEVVFSTTATTAQLTSAFPGYVVALASEKAQIEAKQAQALLIRTDNKFRAEDIIAAAGDVSKLPAEAQALIKQRADARQTISNAATLKAQAATTLKVTTTTATPTT